MSSVIPLPAPSPFVGLVAENVRIECAKQDWSQADVARALRAAPAAINVRWRGQRQWQLEDLEKLATAMGIPVTSFFARSDAMERESAGHQGGDRRSAPARSEGLEPPTFWSVVTSEPDPAGAAAEHSAEVFDFATGKRVA